jgi:hypothetical protein
LTLTIDEELEVLEDAMRRLKVEYDMYFGGGLKRPPTDLEWKVQALVKKFSDTQKLSFGQRFKYNSIAQRYAIFSELWRQKLRIKEEGCYRPEDPIMAIQGLRTDEERSAARALKESRQIAGPEAPFFTIGCADPDRQIEQIRVLYDAMRDAKQRLGESSPADRFEGFLSFIKSKTQQIRKEFACEAVEYRVEVKDRKVRLVAKAAS